MGDRLRARVMGPRDVCCCLPTHAVADIAEASLAGDALLSFLAGREQPWTGTATELLERLNEQLDEQQRKAKAWPNSPEI